MDNDSNDSGYTYAEEKFMYVLDILADEFCELDDNGQFVIKPEYRK